MNSYNHYAYGAVADWLYRYAAGVDASPLDAGFHTVVLHPVFDARLGSVAFDYDSPYGTIHSEWKVTGSTAVWHLTLPANSRGVLTLTPAEATHYKLNGQPLKADDKGIQLEAGSYIFTVDL